MSDTDCQRRGCDNSGRYHVPAKDLWPPLDDTEPAVESCPEYPDPCEEAAQVCDSQSCAVETHTGRYFDSGAYRDEDDAKNDYAGYLSPIVVKAFGDYMTRHRVQSNGVVRASDNWKKGIPPDVYFRSMFRHFVDVWMEFEGYKSRDGLDEALGGLMFNVQGFWMETLRERDTEP